MIRLIKVEKKIGFFTLMEMCDIIALYLGPEWFAYEDVQTKTHWGRLTAAVGALVKDRKAGKNYG